MDKQISSQNPLAVQNINVLLWQFAGPIADLASAILAFCMAAHELKKEP